MEGRLQGGIVSCNLSSLVLHFVTGNSYVVVVSAFSTTMEGPLQLTVAAETPDVEILEVCALL